MADFVGAGSLNHPPPQRKGKGALQSTDQVLPFSTSRNNGKEGKARKRVEEKHPKPVSKQKHI
ncbi:hypothetical protein OsI_20568 [Oryza sativa Indica Group]|uniref:Uncharacterized protein n=1 Tax=Oryza sativa subsp. indica TaxID=39946 RepID=B8AZS9_ORYSI|nr:hypothetical protein OsI_20568 [Oryza sativa Indica Group]